MAAALMRIGGGGSGSVSRVWRWKGRSEMQSQAFAPRVAPRCCCSLMSTVEPPSHVMPLSRCSRTGLASLTEQACLSRTPVDALAQRQLSVPERGPPTAPALRDYRSPQSVRHCAQLTCKQWNAMTTEVKEG